MSTDRVNGRTAREVSFGPFRLLPCLAFHSNHQCVSSRTRPLCGALLNSILHRTVSYFSAEGLAMVRPTSIASSPPSAAIDRASRRGGAGWGARFPIAAVWRELWKGVFEIGRAHV